MTGVKGRTALVTGAGSAGGIGFATARLLLVSAALSPEPRMVMVSVPFVQFAKVQPDAPRPPPLTMT